MVRHPRGGQPVLRPRPRLFPLILQSLRAAVRRESAMGRWGEPETRLRSFCLLTGSPLLRLTPPLLFLATLTACTPSPPTMVKIPQGDFVMGSDQVDTAQQGVEFGTSKPWFLDEHPQRTVSLPAYEIDVYEVTNGQYRAFVDTTRSTPPPTWPEGRFPPEQEPWPVTGVTWFEADRYCRWAGKRLPSEAEWEKAARGTDGREFPWGGTFDEKRGNIGGTGLTPVGTFPEGRSPYGVYDMAGNVSEWVADWVGSEFYHASPDRNPKGPDSGEKRALRG